MTNKHVTAIDGTVIHADFERLERKPLSPRQKVGRFALGLVTAGAAAALFSAVSDGPTAPGKQPTHTISYLEGDKMAPKVVHQGDNGESLAKAVNPSLPDNSLALHDAGLYVERESTDRETDGTPQLKPGMAVAVPIMPLSQIEAVDNGRLGNE